MGAQLLKEAATKTNDVAGDGTTTATVLAQAIVTEGLRNVTAGANPMPLKRGIERGVAAVVDEIKRDRQAGRRPRTTSPTSPPSARRDTEIGDLIAEVMDKVGKDGVITVEESRGSSFETEYVEGMQFDRGYISAYFVTERRAAWRPRSRTPYILVTDKKISAVGRHPADAGEGRPGRQARS